MILINKPEELKNFSKNVKRNNGKTIGFVPTMGYLHKGHESLIKLSKVQNDITIVSIYVNPLQFGKNEDFDVYPRDINRDISILSELEIDAVFIPSDDVMYPKDFLTEVYVKNLSEILEGKIRQNHFKGVTTVVLKLLNMTMPTRAYFGEKDYQQYVIIKKMVKDLNLDVEIVPCPTVREENGLALSSRNSFLSEKGKSIASNIYKALVSAKELFEKGQTESEALKKHIREFLEKNGIKEIDYVEIVDEELNIKSIASKKDRILIAARVENVRLLDNLEL